MKKVLILFLLNLFLTNIVFSSEEIILLDSSEINQLKVPDSPILNYVKSNQNEGYKNFHEEENVSFSDEDDIDNKLIKNFYNFVDDRVINNKINRFTSSMVDNEDEKD